MPPAPIAAHVQPLLAARLQPLAVELELPPAAHSNNWYKY
jgi:hypothetical protein